MLLVEKGKPKGSIVVSADASRVERFAAEELQAYIHKVTGARLSIRTDGQAKGGEVFVGKGDRCEGGAAKGMAADSFRIITEDGQLCLLGADDRGTLYGVYTFIEDYLGVSWPHYPEEDEMIPKRQNLRLPKIDRYEEPFLPVRRMVCGVSEPSKISRDAISWMAKNKLNTVYGGSDPKDAEKHVRFITEEAIHKRGLEVCWGGHSFSGWLPPEKYLKRHPEYFALVNGKREPVSICTSNRKVAEEVARNIVAFSRKYPEIQIMGFWPNDDWRWCECEECEKAEPYWASPVNPNPVVGETRMHSGKYIAFANRVAELVTKSRPNLRLETIAYWTTVEPPRDLNKPIHPNLNLCVALIERQYDRALNRPLTEAQLRTTFLDGVHNPWDKNKYSHYPQMLAKWRELVPGPMYFYEYYTASLGCLGCLFPITKSIREDSRFYKAAGMDGFGTQGWLHNWPSYGLSYWFGPRCAWDGKPSHDEILARYCRGYYGSAAEEMKAFFLELADSMSSKRVGLPLRQMVRVFTPAVVAACKGYLEAAKKKARGAKVSARVSHMEVLLRYGELLHRFSELGAAEQRSLKEGKTEDFYRQLGEQMGLQTEVMALLKNKEVFEPFYRDSIHYFFMGVGAFWLQNPWGLYHTLKLLQPLSEKF